jgi:catechol 2,3-dioxygenase-like lactoylglutathione lyase family enzyme
MPHVTALDHLVLTVRDIDKTVAFYGRVLGMGMETFRPADGSARTALTFGRQKINLHLAGAEFEPKAGQVQPGSADLCLLTDDPLDDWIAHLAGAGVDIVDGPVARTGATGPILSIYVRDPDLNLIEIARYA